MKGIQFGVGPEAIELAAVLSFPKSPWLMSNVSSVSVLLLVAGSTTFRWAHPLNY